MTADFYILVLQALLSLAEVGLVCETSYKVTYPNTLGPEGVPITEMFETTPFDKCLYIYIDCFTYWRSHNITSLATSSFTNKKKINSFRIRKPRSTYHKKCKLHPTNGL